MYENDGHLNKRLFIASYPFLSCVLFLLFACKNIEWNRDNRTENCSTNQRPKMKEEFLVGCPPDLWTLFRKKVFFSVIVKMSI